MKYKQERRVRLSTESEHDSLYRWSIQEMKPDGSLIKRDWIPWYHSVYFQIIDLTHFQNMKIEKKSDNDDFVAGSEAEPSAIEETISGTLRPMSDSRSRTSYSMFGTDRIIKEFDLLIKKNPEGEKEQCYLWGSLSYEYEWDFEDLIARDSVGVSIYLDPYQFDCILEQMRAFSTNEGFIRLNFVSGFYSDWSPSIRTSEIKILADIKDQKIEIPEDCRISPPILGYVGTFEMTLKNRKIFDKQEKDEIEEKVKPTDENVPPNAHAVAPENREKFRLENKIGKLLTPLWWIFAVLVINLLFK